MSEAAPSPAARRSAAWTVFGVIDIVLGALGGLVGVASLLMKPDPEMAEQSPALKAMADSQLYQAYSRIGAPPSLVAAALLVIAGIGLLRCAGWGRTLSLVWAWYTIVAGLVGLVVAWIAVISPLLAYAAQAAQADRLTAYTAIVGGLIGAFAVFVYPVLLLVFLRRDARIGE